MSEEIIKRYKIRAKKALGQNFLVNNAILKFIAEAIEVEWKSIIEVGPWYGALTEKLLDQKPKNLQLIELDKSMIEILNDRIDRWELESWEVKFSIENIDILKFQWNDLFQDYSVIANIPYYITSPILRHFLYTLDNKPENMVILLQKDVWDKILLWQEYWDRSKTSVLSLIVAKKTHVREVIVVPSDNFIPAPKVESSVLVFRTHSKYDEYCDKKFLKLIKVAFVASRKKLSKNLMNGGFEKIDVTRAFGRLHIDPMARPENLWIETWCKLSEELY